MMQLVAQLSGASAATRIGLAQQGLQRRLAGLMPQLSSYSVAASLAGAAGYAVGMVVHYILSSRFVFKTRGSQKSERRRFVEFLISGLIGITLTGVIIAAATEIFGVTPIAAKVVAAAVSFAAVFAIRRSFVFAV